MHSPANPCPCGTTRAYADCCGRYIDGPAAALDAESLMRSRYTAYTLGRETYLLATWHASTRPGRLALALQAPVKWLGLEVRQHAANAADPHHATVEFVARHKAGGRAQRLHETSRFVREDGRWFYVDGDIA
jgi:SEC-C motif-containing protein